MAVEEMVHISLREVLTRVTRTILHQQTRVVLERRVHQIHLRLIYVSPLFLHYEARTNPRRSSNYIAVHLQTYQEQYAFSARSIGYEHTDTSLPTAIASRTSRGLFGPVTKRMSV